MMVGLDGLNKKFILVRSSKSVYVNGLSYVGNKQELRKEY